MSVKSIEKTLSTLDFFISNMKPGGLALKDVCASLGFKKSAAHHMLATVCQKGYLYQDLKTKKYLIGSKIKKMSKLAILDDTGFSDFAFDPIAKELLEADEILNTEFQEKRKNDSKFAENHMDQLLWIFHRSKYYEPEHKRYPIMRVY